MKQQRVISNIYELPDPVGEEVEETIEQKVRESINRETSTYDTHPSPAVRFRLIENLESRYAPGLEDTRPSLELFPNLARLREEMTGRIRNNVAASILQAKAQAAANARK